MFQDLLGTFPLFVSVITDHLNDFSLNISQYFIISPPFRALDVKFGATDIVIKSRQLFHAESPSTPPGLAWPNICRHEFLKSISRSNHASSLEESANTGGSVTPFGEFWSQFNFQIYHTTRQVISHHFFTLCVQSNHWDSGIKPIGIPFISPLILLSWG
jgi:hypothetical protein